MISRARLIAFLLGLAGTSVLLGATAAADDGSTTRTCTAPDGKPSCTILRPPTPPARVPPPGAPECIVTVGGLGSSNDDGTFTDLLATFRDDPRYVIHRFGSSGEDPARYPYDTYGSIDASGRALRDYVRSISGQCHRIHIVSHSMGGDVADRAFSLGLSGADGVVTYEPISGPHNGAMIARYVAKFIDSDEPFADAASEIAQALHVHDPTTPAVRDLARIKPPRPPRDVAELRQRLADDGFVYLPDNWDRRFEIRDWLPDADLVQLEGHGGSLRNAEIRATTVSMIRTGVVPPDTRSEAHKTLAFIMSVALLIIALIVGKYLEKPILEAIFASKAITIPMGFLLPLLVGPLTGFLKFTLGVVGVAKGIISLLKDHLPVEDAEDVGEKVIHVIVDPHVAMVRGVLDRAAQLLARR